MIVFLSLLITTSAVLHLRADHLKHQTPDHDPHHIPASPPNGESPYPFKVSPEEIFGTINQ